MLHRYPTLRDLAGLRSVPTPLAESALLVIDAQVAYSPSGVLPIPDIDAATAHIAQLLAEARRRVVPIIHVGHGGSPGSPFDPVDGGRFLPATTPNGDEMVVKKTLPNAFARTNLTELIEALGRPLVICGFMTHMCVSSTARAALDLGWETSIVSDATATRPLRSALSGHVVDAATMHDAALSALADRFSAVAPTSAFLDTPEQCEVA